ncbi:integrase catalytic domain-containing protein [Trichonephila clavipes]|nr:integrase catalytic domain-containing protein [Trichonephila clavipes]
MLVTQIEAFLNSLPLSPFSSDSSDLNPLTPGHFLTGNAISSFPEPYTASDSLSYHSRWKLIQSEISSGIVGAQNILLIFRLVLSGVSQTPT